MQITEQDARVILMVIDTHEMEADASTETRRLAAKIYRGFPALAIAKKHRERVLAFWSKIVEKDPRVRAVRRKIATHNRRSASWSSWTMDGLTEELHTVKAAVAQELAPKYGLAGDYPVSEEA